MTNRLPSSHSVHRRILFVFVSVLSFAVACGSDVLKGRQANEAEESGMLPVEVRTQPTVITFIPKVNSEPALDGCSVIVNGKWSTKLEINGPLKRDTALSTEIFRLLAPDTAKMLIFGASLARIDIRCPEGPGFSGLKKADGNAVYPWQFDAAP